MPPAKRALAEADPNASSASNRTNKSAKILKKVGNGYAPYALGSKENLIDSNHKHESESSRKEEITYTTKDNSKLRTLLSERGLSTLGSREELISRLENSSIDYESLLSGDMTEMLKARHITMASQGPKAVKIQRLRLNDKLDRDTGNYEDTMLYARLSVAELILEELVTKQKKAQDENTTYTMLKPGRIIALLEKRKLPRSGSQTAQIKRLQNDDLKSIAKKLMKIRKERDSLKLELESKVGHPVNASEELKKEDKLRAIDNQIERQAHNPSPKPICDYNWQDSHWADRTGQQLREICSRREMPGSGPKAAMLKWLDTGNVEYEDLYTSGLESMCRDRGIHYKSGAKKAELVTLLREADENEE